MTVPRTGVEAVTIPGPKMAVRVPGVTIVLVTRRIPVIRAVVPELTVAIVPALRQGRSAECRQDSGQQESLHCFVPSVDCVQIAPHIAADRIHREGRANTLESKSSPFLARKRAMETPNRGKHIAR